ncbi:dephospho-CoA kinase [Ruania suaedae]|nr:dephospho-CoA kinase [Ruania suaedae]
MLSVGLTGGIGAGKSTVTRMLEARGAVVIDADLLAREVLAPGTPGLDEVFATFGEAVRAGDGSLDRAALARVVFGDEDARQRLNAIVHPRVRSAAAEREATLGPGAVVVHDIPLLVENDLAADHHLVIVVGAPQRVRLERLGARGMPAEDARARMAAQADDTERRRVADVWIDNGGAQDETERQVAELWVHRIDTYAHNLQMAALAERPVGATPVPDPGGPRSWAAQAAVLGERIRRAGGPHILTVEHIGSTAVPALEAKDVLDLQVGVADLATAHALAGRLTDAGFPPVPGEWSDRPEAGADDEASAWTKLLHANADPGRHVNAHVRVADGPGWRYALLFRDWLRAVPSEREEYARLKRSLAARTATTGAYAEAKEPWFDRAWPRMQAWAQATGWHPPTR